MEIPSINLDCKALQGAMEHQIPLRFRPNAVYFGAGNRIASWVIASKYLAPIASSLCSATRQRDKHDTAGSSDEVFNCFEFGIRGRGICFKRGVKSCDEIIIQVVVSHMCYYRCCNCISLFGKGTKIIADSLDGKVTPIQPGHCTCHIITHQPKSSSF